MISIRNIYVALARFVLTCTKLSIAVPLLSGCASSIRYDLLASGKSEQQYNVDSYECERDTRMAAASFAQPRQPDSSTYQVSGNTIYQRSAPDPATAMANLGASLTEIGDRREFMRRCMAAHGYLEAAK